MSDYKLVPVEPTAEMVEAAQDAHMPFGDMDIALRMALLAAPAVQGEPVAYAVFADNGNIQIWSSDPAQVQALKHEFGDRVEPLYRHPAGDVSALVEALEDIGHSCHGISSEIEKYMRGVARNALAAYRNQGGEECPH